MIEFSLSRHFKHVTLLLMPLNFFSAIVFSLGDGISYPIQMMDEEDCSTTLLGNNYVECDATDSGTENLEF